MPNKIWWFIDKIIVSALSSSDKGNFSGKDKILLLKQLAYLLKWWVSLVEALQILIESTDNFAIKDIANTVLGFIKRGKPLSYAFNRLPDFFTEWDFAIVKSGEMSGSLPRALESLATEYVYIGDIKNKYVWAMIYPIILIVVAIVSVIALFTLVLPSVFSIADSFVWVELPWITQVIRWFSAFLQNNRVALLRGIAWLSAVLWLFFSTENGKKIWFKLLLSIPLIGKMTKYYYVVKFCRYLKLMLWSGMNYIETFALLKDILEIPAYQDMIENVLSWLKRWENIYDNLKMETALLPNDVPVMIKVWEQTANLDKTLDNVLNMYDVELNMMISNLSKIIEPIMLVFIGWIVVVIAYAVFGLILQIMSGVGG